MLEAILLEKPIVASVGIFLWWILGYMVILALDVKGQIGSRGRCLLAFPVFYVLPWSACIANIVLGGAILSSRQGFLVFFTALTLAILLLSSRRIPSAAKETVSLFSNALRSTSAPFGLAFVTILLTAVAISSAPVGLGMSLGGDVNKHLMYTNQLLAGYPISGLPPYDTFPRIIHYPFLLHGTTAFWVRLLGVDVFLAYFLVHVCQAFLLPLGVYWLMKGWTSRPWLGLLAMALVTLYGGHHIPWQAESWWYSVAIERILPHHITRTSSLALVPFFLYCLVEGRRWPEERVWVFVTGLLLGLTGAIHAYALVWGLVVISFSALPAGSGLLKVREAVAIIAIGIAIASSAYLPFFLLSNGGMGYTSVGCQGILSMGNPGQVLLNARRMLQYYGILIFPVFLSLVFWRRSCQFQLKRAVVLSGIFIILLTWAKGWVDALGLIGLPYHPTQQKFGKAIFISMVVLSIDVIASTKQWLKNSKFKKALTVAGVLVGGAAFVSGLISTLNFAAIWSIQGAMGVTNEAYLRETNLIQVFRRLSPGRATVAVPGRISKIFASLTGLHLLYMEHPKSYSHERFFCNSLLYAPDEVIDRLQRETHIPYRDVAQEILRRYKVSYLVVPKGLSSRFQVMRISEVIAEGKWKGGDAYKVLKVKEVDDCSNPIAKTSGLDLLLSSRFAWESVAGFVPLCKERVVVPRLIGRRDMTFDGFLFDGRSLWLHRREGGKFIRVDVANGKVSSFPWRGDGGPLRIAWGNGSMWILDAQSGKLYSYRPVESTTQPIATFTALKGSPGLAWGGGGLWAVGDGGEYLYYLPLEDLHPIRYAMLTEGILDVAYHDGHPWVLLPGGRVCRVTAEGVEDGQCLASPAYQLSRVVWDHDALWALDLRSNALIRYRPIKLRQ